MWVVVTAILYTPVFDSRPSIIYVHFFFYIYFRLNNFQPFPSIIRLLFLSTRRSSYYKHYVRCYERYQTESRQNQILSVLMLSLRFFNQLNNYRSFLLLKITKQDKTLFLKYRLSCFLSLASVPLLIIGNRR